MTIVLEDDGVFFGLALAIFIFRRASAILSELRVIIVFEADFVFSGVDGAFFLVGVVFALVFRFCFVLSFCFTFDAEFNPDLVVVIVRWSIYLVMKFLV